MRWLWPGAVTDTSVVAACGIDGATTVRFAADTDPGFSNPVFSAAVTPDAQGVAKAAISGLTADTAYHLAVEADTVLVTGDVGGFSTRPTPGTAASYSFWFGSTQRTGSNHVVFDTIRGLGPAFGIHLGDLHQEHRGDTGQDTSPSTYQDPLEQALTAARFRDLAKAHPWAYTPNAGDGGGSAWRGSPGTATLRQVFAQYVPHPGVDGDGAWYRPWVHGRPRFLLLDTRSRRDQESAPNTPSKTLLGDAQKNWLKNQLLTATEPVIFLCCPFPWRGDDPNGWGKYPDEFDEINSFIVANNLAGRVVILAGGLGAVAADSGEVDAPPGLEIRSASTHTVDWGQGDAATVAAPSGVQEGDLLVAFQTSSGDPKDMGAAGWQQLTAVEQPSVNTIAWWKTAGGGEPATYEFTFTTGFDGVIAIVAVQGAAQQQPLVSVLVPEDDQDVPTGTVTTPTTEPGRANVDLRWATGLPAEPPTWTEPDGTTLLASLTGGAVGPVATAALAARNLPAGPTGVHEFTVAPDVTNSYGITVNVPAAPTPDSAQGPPGLRLLVGSNLDDDSSASGGYSEGLVANAAGAGQFGWITVTDDGNQITLDYIGYDDAETELVTYSAIFGFPGGTLVWDGTTWQQIVDIVVFDGTNWVPTAAVEAWDGAAFGGVQ